MKTILLTKWVYWPTLDEELSNHKFFLKGKILNAGCGTRKVTFPRVDKTIGMDIVGNENVDVIGNLEHTPFNNAEFDGILNIAVLEHCKKPWKAVQEMGRILKQKGKIICCVPFMQPIHKIPNDYFRFTPDGIVSLFKDNGFTIIKTEYTHSIFHIVGWYIEEFLKQQNILLQIILFPFAKLSYLITKYFSHINIKTIPCVITILGKRN